MYFFRTQLQSAADAAALAGAVGLGNGEKAAAANDVTDYLAKDSVGGTQATLDSSRAGTWDGTFHAGNWTDANANAVQVHVSYQASYSFARVFGKTTQTLHANAVAVHGSVGKQSCVRPWAVSYQSLLDQLKKGYTIGHDLTAADVLDLQAATVADEVTMNAAGTDGVPHQMRSVRMGPAEYGTAPFPGSPNSPNANDYRMRSSRIARRSTRSSAAEGSA